jgi:hypothetical protein
MKTCYLQHQGRLVWDQTAVGTAWSEVKLLWVLAGFRSCCSGCWGHCSEYWLSEVRLLWILAGLSTGWPEVQWLWLLATLRTSYSKYWRYKLVWGQVAMDTGWLRSRCSGYWLVWSQVALDTAWSKVILLWTLAGLRSCCSGDWLSEVMLLWGLAVWGHVALVTGWSEARLL